ncbi:hypothetical protein D3C87_1100200 [compost metagenome]
MATAETAKMVCQPPVRPAIRLDTGRANMIPISSPLVTLPTTRPRIWSGARCAANGTSTCTATEHRPMAQPATRNTLAWVASAAAVSATAQPPISVRISLRFSTRSPSGTSSTSPTQ